MNQKIELAYKTIINEILKEETSGTIETPKRATKALAHLTKGYAENPADILKIFDESGMDYDDFIEVKNIVFYSLCEHHLAPFFGEVSIKYKPNKDKVVGLSKLSRLVDIFARRFQVQERMTVQIAEAIMEHLDALHVVVKIEARHLCMESRGICKHGSTTITRKEIIR
jgi:GTP cyclohydrolase I